MTNEAAFSVDTNTHTHTHALKKKTTHTHTHTEQPAHKGRDKNVHSASTQASFSSS